MTSDGPRVVATYKGYRITASGKKFKIYKPEGGSLIYLRFETIEECQEVIDDEVAHAASQDTIVFASDCD